MRILSLGKFKIYILWEGFSERTIMYFFFRIDTFPRHPSDRIAPNFEIGYLQTGKGNFFTMQRYLQVINLCIKKIVSPIVIHVTDCPFQLYYIKNPAVTIGKGYLRSLNILGYKFENEFPFSEEIKESAAVLRYTNTCLTKMLSLDEDNYHFIFFRGYEDTSYRPWETAKIAIEPMLEFSENSEFI